jgi:hypothetical protein
MQLNYFKWEAGRQGSGYDKMLLAAYFKPFVLQFDCYLLRFPLGSSINWHIDPVTPPLRYYRLNIFLKQPKKGGVFKLARQQKPIYGNRFLQLFRPDIQPHKVTTIEEGTRYVLSIGWVR